jgi:uncharacterized protein YdaU (DUF1376 family)
VRGVRGSEGQSEGETGGVNYYEHHLGDYDGATAHLSWLEDCAYRRMLGLYYRTEAPLPVDVARVCRLVRATTKPERDAVRQVLEEFFELTDDGWHNARCDEDIAAYHDLEPEREAKRENTKERQRRARERRAALFETLRGHNIVPPYDTTTKTLEALLSRVTSQPEVTQPVTPVTRDDTATHTQLPTPTSQSQITPTEKVVLVAAAVETTAAPPPPDPPPPPPAPAPTPAPPAPAPSAAKASPARGTRLAEDWKLPKAWGEWAQQAYPHWDADTVRLIAEKFRNHWRAATGKAATKLDWLATWQNWCHSGITQKEHPPAKAAPAPRGGGLAPEWAQERDAHRRAFYGPAAAKSPDGQVIDMEDDHDEAERLTG